MVTSYFRLLLALFIQGVFSQESIRVDEKAGNLHVKCEQGTLMQDGKIVGTQNELNLGSLWNDPRGLYYCNRTTEPLKNEYVHVYVRRCMNCIELDPGTIAGFIVADAIMIFFIATAVYFVSGSEIRRPGRASDKQNLIERDADYQALGRRDNEPYSRLAPRPNRGAF